MSDTNQTPTEQIVESTTEPIVESTISITTEVTQKKVVSQPPPPSAQQKLEQLKQTCRMIINTFRDETTDINRALSNYKYILNHYQSETLYGEECRKYLSDRFLEDSCIALMKREHHHFNSDYNMADTINDCCKMLINIAVPLVKDDSQLAMQIIYYCMNSSNPFFRHFGHDWRQRRGNELDGNEILELKEWRETGIKEGEYVDYLLSNRWRYGIIKKIVIKEDSNNKKNKFQLLQIAPCMDQMYPTHRSSTSKHNQQNSSSIVDDSGDDSFEFTEDFTLSSTTTGQIAKPLTKSTFYLPNMIKWRKELSEKDGNNKCDVLDSVHKWYTCTILEVDPGANRFKINYDGWSSRYDEFIFRDEMKCQPYKTQAKGGRESQGVQGSLEDLEPCCEDDEDLDNVFAVYRGRLIHQSFHLMDIINEFGKCGGFEAIIQRLGNHKPNIPVKNLRFIISPLSKCFKMYSRKTASYFIPQIHKLTFETLEMLSDIELRDLRKEFLERIVNSIENFLKRFKTSEEIAEIIETFQLKMAIRRLKCITIERRVNGISYIADICSRTRRHAGYGYTTRFITPEFLMKWIEDNKLLELLFGKQSHPQLMKQSVDILKFICTESKLQLSHLDIIWDAMERASKKQDDVENELQTLCSVIDSLTYYLDLEHFNFLFGKFEKINCKTFTIHHLTLMSALSKNTSKNSDPPQRCLNILWNIVQDESGCIKTIRNQAKVLIKECLSSIFSQELRLPTMQKCITNITNHKSVCSSLQLLVKIIELYPTTTHMSNEPVRWTIIGHLHDEKKLLDHFFNDIKYFKQQQKTNNKMDDRQQYLNEIKERLQFLQYVLSNNHTIKLTQNYVNILWESFIVNSLIEKEKELTFNSFKKMVHSGRPIKYIYLQENVPEILFKNNIMKDIKIINMTQSSYECFERYFQFVNCQKNYLQMLENNKHFMVNNYYDLIGLNMLWEIALKCKTTIVHKKSTDMINKICNRVSSELKSEIGKIRSNILEKYIMNELLQSLNKSEDDSDNTIRILNLLHHFLNASESRGMCGLRPHESLSRGKKWHLTIIDKIHFNGYGKPPQFKITIHENDSLWDLRRAIGKKVDTYPELIRTYYKSSSLNEDKNSQSLQQLNMKDNIIIHVMKKDQKSERVPLLTGTPARLVAPCKNALTQVFKSFASNEDGTMAYDDMKRYILKCGAGENSASKTRIQGIFTQHGTQRGPYNDRLSLHGFFNFYRSACMDRPDHVWNDLGVFKYRYDLRKEDEARKEEEALLNAKPDTLPRYILTTNNKYFDILFNHCLKSNNNKIKQMAWKLILRLPTNPHYKKQIMSIMNDDNNKVIDWELLLPTNNEFSLVYGVLICESLTIEPESTLNDKELQERANWRAAFLKQKGFEHLIKILFTFKYNNNNNNNNVIKDDTSDKQTQQLALTSVLKMIQSFFVGAISCNQSMGDVVDQIRSLSLNNTKAPDNNDNNDNNNNNNNTSNNNNNNNNSSNNNTKLPDKKSQKKFKNKKKKSYGSAELYDIDYAYLIDSDDDDDDDDDDGNDNGNEDFTALLEQQFADLVMKESGMPESMYNETKNEWDQLEGLTGGNNGNNNNGGGSGEGDGFIGPKLPHEYGGGQLSDEKDGKEEKGPPNYGDEDIDVDMISADLPDNDNDNDNKDDNDNKEEKKKDDDDDDDEEEEPPITHRQSSIRFHELIKNVTEKYATELLNSLDFSKLMKQLLNILKVASSDKSPTVQRDLVVRYAIRLWVSVLLYRPRLLLDLFSFLRKDPSFILVAIQSKDTELGNEFAKSIRKLCHYVDESPNYKSDEDLMNKLPGISIVKFFLEEILLTHLPNSNDINENDIDPEQHFYLLISLMQEYTSDKYKGTVSEFSNLFKYLISELKQYKSTETFDNTENNDKILVGLMTLLSVLLMGHIPYRKECGELGIIQELLNNFLFATGKTDKDKKLNLPKCKTSISRELAYRLVVQCILQVPSNYEIVNNILSSLHKKVRIPNAWEYCPEKSIKSDRGFVGLKNLGSTCYMNSLLQQFYMIPHFRHALITSGVDLISSEKNKMTSEQMKESLLFQLMRMFSFLSLSEKQAFDTINFCRAYKDETGKPVDVRIQQDAQEFFTILADRVETELKDTKYRFLLQDVFGGQVVHQMICQGGCNKTRERKQPMPMISLPIKNRINMQQSLEAFVQSESLDGVSCDYCGKKCQTLKRQVLHTLPNTIFFHLKRFELNFETFRHEKSNQRFEFPITIDLEPYTREGLIRIEKEKNENKDGDKDKNDQKNENENENKNKKKNESCDNKEDNKEENKYTIHAKEYYEYQLVGIVVHTGSAEAGHYYSYIKDRKTNEWNEFNDSLIKSFDLKYLDNDCYGGKKKVKSSANWGGDWEHDQDKIKNAYILVYDRKNYLDPIHPDENKVKDDDEKNKNKTNENEAKQEQDSKQQEQKNDQDKSMSVMTTTTNKDDDDEEKKDDDDDDDDVLPPPINVLTLFDANVQEHVEKIPKVWQDILDTNMKFMRDRQLFNLQYFQFIYNLICAAPTPAPTPNDEQNEEKDNDNNNNHSNPGLDVIKMATFVCFRFLARTADKRIIFNRFVTYLKFLYTSNIAACQWLLQYLSTQRQHVEQYILTTRDQLVMHGFSDLIIHVLKQLSDIEGDKLMETEEILQKKPIDNKDKDKEKDKENKTFIEEQVTVSKSSCSKFMDLMIELIEIAPKHWFRFNYFFKVFYEYSLMGYNQRNYLINKQLINILGDFYLGGNRSPYADGKKQYHIMGNRMYPPKFDIIVQILCTLLCACHTPQTKKYLNFYKQKKEQMDDKTKQKWLKLSPTALSYTIKDDDNDGTYLHELSDKDAKLPHSRFLYDKMINEAHHSKDILTALNKLVVHWSYEDKTYSEEVIRMITEGVDKSGADQVQTFLSIMHHFIMIDDDQQEYRLNQLHTPQQSDKSILHFIKCYRLQHQPFSYESIKALTFMMIESDKYAKYMIKKRKQWIFWDTWLDNYCHRPTYIHNTNNQRLTQAKIAFYKEKYIPLLKKYNIECQRAQHNQMNQMNNINRHHGGGGGGGQYNQGHQQHYNVQGGGYQGVNYQENYFQDGQNNNDGSGGGQPGGGGGGVNEYGDHGGDGYDGGGAAGAQRQNSRNDSDLYGNNDIIEGGDHNDAASGDDMQMQGVDDDDDVQQPNNPIDDDDDDDNQHIIQDV